jgi:hypothetical protein
VDALLAIADAQPPDPSSARSAPDLPYRRSPRPTSRVRPGAIGPGETLAARTALTALTRALEDYGLQVQPIDNGLSASGPAATLAAGANAGRGPAQTLQQVVILAHHPDDRNRLWWWLPAGGGGTPRFLHPCARATDIRATAGHIARLLAVPPRQRR